MNLKSTLLLLFSAVVLASAPGCHFFHRSKKPKPNPNIAEDVETNFKARWMEKRVGELTAAGTPRELSLVIQYADTAPLRVLLHSGTAVPETGSSLFIAQRRPPTYRVAGIEQDETRLSLHAGVARTVPRIARPVTGPDLTQTQPVGTTTFKPAIDDDPYYITPPIEVPFE
jgi:hypothetical protein